ncbi:MAG: penicillin-binding protein 2, partial [Betaproteobacteria bacterium]
MRRAGSSRAAPATGGTRGGVGFNSNPLLAVRLPAWRSKMRLFTLYCAFAALAGRAFYLLGGVNTEFLQKQGEARYARTLEV